MDTDTTEVQAYSGPFVDKTLSDLDIKPELRTSQAIIVLDEDPTTNARNENAKPAKQNQSATISYSCKDCQLTLPTLLELKRHELTHATRDQGHRMEFKIPRMSTPESSSSAYKLADNCTNYSSTMVTRKQLDMLASQPNVGDPLATFECSQCQEKFLEKVDLIRHKCGFSSDGKNEDEYEEEAKQYQCRYCEVKLKSPSMKYLHESKSHSAEYTPIKPRRTQNICTICSRKFKTKSGLNAHVSSVHLGRPLNKKICPPPPESQSAMQEGETPNSKANDIEIPEPPPQFTSLHELESSSIKIATINRPGLLTRRRAVVPFHCTHCNEEFPGQEELTQHSCNPSTLKQSKVHEYTQCHLCESKFKAHMKTVHLAKFHKEEYNRLKQEGILKTRPTRKRLVKKNIKKYRCTECDMKFSKPSLLTRHMKTVHLNQKPYECQVCNMKFSQSSSRDRHLFNVHEIGEKRFKCETDGCDYSGFSNRELNLHRARWNHGEDQVEVKLVDVYHSCNVCGKCFIKSEEKGTHGLVHKEENNPYTCEFCDSKFPSFPLRNEHQNNCQLEDFGGTLTGDLKLKARKFKCGYCDRSDISTESELKHHLTSHVPPPTTTHKFPMPKRFKCKLCIKYFAHRHVRDSHERTHTGEVGTPFKCNNCEKSYTRSEQLRRHVLIHHSADYVPPIPKYACSHCEKKYHTSGGFKAHMLSHTKEKPFQCHKCGESFRDKGKMTKHIIFKHRYDEDVQKEYWQPESE